MWPSIVKRSRRAKAPREPRIRTERRLPGVSAPALGARPWATIVLVGLSMGMWLALVWIADFDVIPFDVAAQPEKVLYGVFAYFNGWYQLAVLAGIGIFGWLLERHHAQLAVHMPEGIDPGDRLLPQVAPLVETDRLLRPRRLLRLLRHRHRHHRHHPNHQDHRVKPSRPALTQICP